MPRTTQMFQLYDLTAQAVVGPILLEKAPGAAIRSFNSVLGNKNTQPGQYPQDFNLLFIGFQDDETGEITAEGPQTLATGKHWLESQGASGVAPLALAPRDADRAS